MLTTGTKNVRSYVAMGLALALMIVAAVALFVSIQNVLPYVAFIRGQFYTPVPNSSETILNRAFSKTGLAILRLAFWPTVLFILLEIGATYSVSSLVYLDGRFAATRRLLVACGLTLLTTVVLLVPMWRVLERFAARGLD